MVKKRLLVLTPRFPFPPIGGDRLRILQVCRQLSAEYELTLLSLCGTREELEAPVETNGIFSAIHRVYHPLWRRAWGVAGALPTRTPLQVGYYRNSEFARRLLELAPNHDGILAHLIRTGDYLKDIAAPKFLEMTDAISLGYSRAGEIGKGGLIRSLVYRFELPRLLRYEVEAIRNFDLVVLVSGVDRDFLVQDGDAENILVCPVGVDVNAFPFNYAPDGKTIVYIGNMTSHQNIDAVNHFVRDIFPLIRARIPGAQFRVVGRIEARTRREFERQIGVSVTGAVDAVPGSVIGASAGVCPIRFGAGMQNKLLEYMALGIPAVTSRIGLEGLNATPDRHLLVADSPRQWAEKVCWLLEDGARARLIALSARELVEKQYSWTATIAPLRAAIANQLKSSRSAA